MPCKLLILQLLSVGLESQPVASEHLGLADRLRIALTVGASVKAGVALYCFSRARADQSLEEFLSHNEPRDQR